MTAADERSSIMANVLIQSQNTANINPKMDSLNNNIAVEADKNGIKPETNDDNVSNLMEKLRSKTNQTKSWTDLTKLMKQPINEKRHIDVNERSQLQKCLDTIQKSIRVTSWQSMVERLETICRQLGLKFSVPPQTSPKRVECFVHSEMYYVEVLLESPTGHVLDCKVAHQAEALVGVPRPCCSSPIHSNHFVCRVVPNSPMFFKKEILSNSPNTWRDCPLSTK